MEREEYEDLLQYLGKKYQLFINAQKTGLNNQIQIYQISNSAVNVTDSTSKPKQPTPPRMQHSLLQSPNYQYSQFNTPSKQFGNFDLE